MPEYIITGDADETDAAELQEYAARVGWGRVEPLTQQRLSFRDGREAVIQKRGAAFFALAYGGERPRFAGPVDGREKAALAAIALARADVEAA